MKGSLPAREPDWLAKWERMDIYGQLRAKGRDNPDKFILHDGPPYANGNIHNGHAMNKTLKDIIVRSQQMSGKDAPYVPGWDCHGLPIEWMIEKQYQKKKIKKDDIDPIEFRMECRNFAAKWVDVQREEFKRLGIFGDWDKPYLTMNFDSEAQIVRELQKFLMNGDLYRGSKPIMWSVVEKTALAEAEIEYQDHTSHVIDVGFTVVKSAVDGLIGSQIVIWTTTPWTIPGNRGLAYGKDIDYLLFEVLEVSAGSRVAVGRKISTCDVLKDALLDRAGITKIKELSHFKGSDLMGTICHHPWHDTGYDFDVPVIEGYHVTTEAGTGYVHIAPSHGQEDFEVGKAAGLAAPFTVDDGGVYYDSVPMFAGEHVYKVHDHVCEELETVGALLTRDTIVHSYPHSWRSKAPLIFRNTPQWFISMDNNGLRDKAVAEVDKVRWVPENSKNRMMAMVSDRPDWLLSRQRAWGVPITVFFHKETGDLLRDDAVNARIALAVEAAGADAWYGCDSQEFLGDAYNADDYDKVEDILDVWFDSGSTHAFVLENRPELRAPADLYVEGTDQHRGWFQSSLLESCGTRGHAPYKNVLTHGFTLDDKGKKMSKSGTNSVAPQKIIDQFGADILRLWVTSTDYMNDHRIGNNIIQGQVEAYRKIRNTMRFLLGNLDNFDDAEKLPLSEMPEMDRLILHRLSELNEINAQAIADYNYNRIYTALYNFFTVDLSAFYFDIRKDCLYCDGASSIRRRATRSVLDQLFFVLTKIMAPILVFTAEEIWQSRFPNENDSIHLQVFHDIPDDWRDNALAAKWEKIRTLRKAVTGALEVERREKRIGSSLQGQVKIFVTDPSYIEAAENIDLAELSITSKAELVQEPAPEGAFRHEDSPDIAVVSTLADGGKCERCWQTLPEVSTIAGYDNICPRCASALQEAE